MLRASGVCSRAQPILRSTLSRNLGVSRPAVRTAIFAPSPSSSCPLFHQTVRTLTRTAKRSPFSSSFRFPGSASFKFNSSSSRHFFSESHSFFRNFRLPSLSLCTVAAAGATLHDPEHDDSHHYLRRHLHIVKLPEKKLELPVTPPDSKLRTA